MTKEEITTMNNIEQLSFLGAPMVATDYIWRLADGYPKSNGLKVFSCFSCGGGTIKKYIIRRYKKVAL